MNVGGLKKSERTYPQAHVGELKHSKRDHKLTHEEERVIGQSVRTVLKVLLHNVVAVYVEAKIEHGRLNLLERRLQNTEKTIP